MSLSHIVIPCGMLLIALVIFSSASKTFFWLSATSLSFSFISLISVQICKVPPSLSLVEVPKITNCFSLRLITLSTVSWVVKLEIANFLFSTHFFAGKPSLFCKAPDFNPASSISNLETPGFKLNPILFWMSLAFLFAIIRWLSWSHNINMFGIISIESLSNLSEFSLCFISEMFVTIWRVPPSGNLFETTNEEFPLENSTSLLSSSTSLSNACFRSKMASFLDWPSLGKNTPFFIPFLTISNLDDPGFNSKPSFFWSSLELLFAVMRLLFLSHNIRVLGITSIAAANCLYSSSCFLISVISV